QSHTYGHGIHTITFTITGTNGCSDTRTYSAFLGTTPAGAIVNPGNTSGCTPFTLAFPVVGTGSNTPGTIYTITFSYCTPPATFTHPPPRSITHTFTDGSCGRIIIGDPGGTFLHSFSANMVFANPCGTSERIIPPILVGVPAVAGF